MGTCTLHWCESDCLLTNVLRYFLIYIDKILRSFLVCRLYDRLLWNLFFTCYLEAFLHFVLFLSVRWFEFLCYNIPNYTTRFALFTLSHLHVYVYSQACTSSRSSHSTHITCKIHFLRILVGHNLASLNVNKPKHVACLILYLCNTGIQSVWN